MDFLKDSSKQFSFMRVAPFIMLMVFTFMWAYVCYVDQSIVDFPPYVVGVIITLITGKVGEKFLDGTKTKDKA